MQIIDAASPLAQSADLMTGNIEQLKALFPELITEGPNGVAVNVDVLKALVGDRTITDTDEKYGLNWHGKRRARQLALTPSTGTLRPCPEESVDWDTTQNLMIEGDNLEVLKLLQKSYAGKVKLIYIDPPYNTGKDFVYPDNFQDNIKNYLELTGQVEGGQKVSSNTEASGRFHTDWLNMLYPRLKLARNLLRADGVIFITIDDNEVASLKIICDEIFGEENLKGILVWQHSLQPKGYSGTFSVHHNYILCYQKSDDFELANLDRTDEHNKNYSNPDNDPNGPWRSGDVRNALYRPNLIYKIATPSGKLIDPPPNGWRWSKETVAAKIQSGEIIFSPDETRIIRKIYLNTLEGRTPETILFGKDVGTTRDAASEIKLLFDGGVPFDTPKPTGLIQHLITLSGARDRDLVMDFFAGSGTTGQAILNQNSANGWHLRSILVQLPEPLDVENKDQRDAANYCDQLGKARTIAELTKERLRRAAAKIKADNPMFAGDTGFRVFKLDHSNIRAWDPNPADLEQTLFAHQDHLVEGRTESDIFYELLLKLGLDLCVPIEQRRIAGCEMHSVGGGVLMACLAERITSDAVEDLAQGIVDWHKELAPAGDTTCVFRDSAFVDDVAKTNLAAILQQQGIDNVRSL
ncbi:site-specific DNA-methyltransferase [Pseudomonas aeruginosa]|uniref:site-specific DNA-methyltransferase n=1 Tax=Pseudomonas aeruginosa TaxID=287 RepID=UPI002B259A03|nr:site-specific DNA-methyltransferase [Pseudomonas aeruginosa]EKX7257447.1 site-specific DNA-methyltransferase [Pseudomonas aeruginosa]WOX90174.1 site-specific DNA-methyltransferase [Pseudomonas aeruginosa]